MVADYAKLCFVRKELQPTFVGLLLEDFQLRTAGRGIGSQLCLREG
jgi:hypothetical protein